MDEHLPNPVPPEEFTGLDLHTPETHAAGPEAIVRAVKHITDAMDIPRGFKALNQLNKSKGFDCPGCAWPDPDDERSRLGEYCENGVKAIAEEATTKKLTAEFFSNHSIEELAALSDYDIGKKGRIAQPMYLAKNASHYTPISWDEAFTKIADQLNTLASPNQAIFYTSGRTSNEAAFLYQLFVREYGTNNLPDCSNMCHESSGVALTESLGIGKGSVKLEDFYKAEVIIILGQNAGTNHPRMLSALQKAKKNGAIIITVNPLPEAGLTSFANPQTVKGMLGITTKLTDIFVQVKINGDLAFMLAVEKLLLEEEHKNPSHVFDHAFIQKHTAGYDAFIKSLSAYSLETLSKDAGVSIQQIREVAAILRDKHHIIACWAMGLTQHKNAVTTIQEVVNLLLLKGSIGKPGAGVCPVRGHSNVQGDRTMGIYEKPSQQLLESIKKTFHFTPPTKYGYDVVRGIHAMHREKAHVFFAMGGNFLSASPDTHYTAEALRKCILTVQVSTKLNRSHLITGEEAIILPTLGRSDKDISNGKEQFVSCENSMGVIQMSKGVLEPVSTNLLSEVAIVCRLALATLAKRTVVDWNAFSNDYDNIRHAIEKTIPGFDNYNVRVRKFGGFYLPNSARELHFPTKTAKANFQIAHYSSIQLKEDELLMMTIRSHDQFNTTIYGLDDHYRGIHHERRVVLMNKKDIERHGLKSGDIVDLINQYTGVERVARKFIIVAYSIPERCVATYFPEANVLVPVNSVANKSITPTSKSVIIRIRKQE